jgi:hypothetical protein
LEIWVNGDIQNINNKDRLDVAVIDIFEACILGQKCGKAKRSFITS